MKRILPAVLLLACASEAWAQGLQGYGGRYRRWMPEVDDGDVRLDNGGLPGSPFDLRDGVGVNDEYGVDEFRLRMNFPAVGEATFEYMQGTFEGDSVLAQDTNVAGTTFLAGTPVETAMEWRSWRLLYEKGGQVAYGVPMMGMVGFQSVSIHTEVDSASATGDGRVKGFVPIIGLRASYPLGRMMTIEGEIYTLLLDVLSQGGVEGSMMDASISGVIELGPIQIGLGYRWLRLDMTDDSTDVDESEVDVELGGWFFEAGVRF